MEISKINIDIKNECGESLTEIYKEEIKKIFTIPIYSYDQLNLCSILCDFLETKGYIINDCTINGRTIFN